MRPGAACGGWLWPEERLAAARAAVGLAACGGAVGGGGGDLAVVEVGWAEVEKALPVMGPAVVRWPGRAGGGLAVVPGGGGRVVVATPGGRRRVVRARHLAAALAAGALAARPEAWERLAARLARRRGRHRRAERMEKAMRAALLASCAPLVVEVQGGESAERRGARWGGLAGALAVAAALERVAGAGGWYLLGRAVLAGEAERGWLVGWALVVLTLPVLRWVELAAGARLAERVALRRRLRRFAELLGRRAGGLRRRGLGWWVSGQFGAEAVEGVVASAATLAVAAVAELLVGGVTMVESAGRGVMALLAATVAGVAAAGIALARAQADLERARRSLTERMVEVFSWTTRGDAGAGGVKEGDGEASREFDVYQGLCRRAARWERWLRVGAPRGWLLGCVGALAVTWMLEPGEPRRVAAAVAGAWWVRVGLAELGAAVVQAGGAWGAEQAAAWGGGRRTAGAAEGAGARRGVVMVPREPYVFAESLAFNLLLGRGWPCTEGDLAEAAAVCRELGLMPVVERMPSGLGERVGEGGWELSAAEACRVGVARALLQGAEEVVIREGCLAALGGAEREMVLAAVGRRGPGVRVVAEK